MKLYDGSPVMEIANIGYQTIQIEGKDDVDALLLQGDVVDGPACQDVGDSVDVACPNTGWSASNPTLCVLAFMGLSPRELDGAIGRTLPFAPTDRDEPNVVPDDVVKTGRRRLRNAAWFVPEDEVDA